MTNKWLDHFGEQDRFGPDSMRTEWIPEDVSPTCPDCGGEQVVMEWGRIARPCNRCSGSGRVAAYYMSTRREYNPNSDKPVCQGGPRWYR